MIKELRLKLFWVSGDWSHDDNSMMKPYVKWLEENCSNYTIQEKWNTGVDGSDVVSSREFMGFAVYFKKDEDALAFKLRWYE